MGQLLTPLQNPCRSQPALSLRNILKIVQEAWFFVDVSFVRTLPNLQIELQTNMV